MLEDANGDSSVLLSVEEHISVSLNSDCSHCTCYSDL